MRTLLTTLGLLICAIPLWAMGTKDIDVNGKGIALSFNKSNNRYNNFMRYDCKEEERLYISLNQGEKLYFGFQVQATNNIDTPTLLPEGTWIRIKDNAGNLVYGPVEIVQGNQGYIETRPEADNGPTQLVGAGGYNALEFLAPTTGDFHMEIGYNLTNGDTDVFNQTYFLATLYDWTVVDNNNNIKPGRVWSKAWHILALGGFSADGALNAKQYIYTDDGIISRLDYNGIIPYQYILISNATGANATGNMIDDRKSIASPFGDELIPQYKLFFDEPDTTIFKLANMDLLFGTLNKDISVTGCPGDYCINIDVNRDANAKLLINMNGIEGFQENSKDVLLEVELNEGENCVQWDGKDGLGDNLQAAAIKVDIAFVAGITHMPMYDVEFNNNGLHVDFIYPESIAKQAEIYWDDSKLDGSVNTQTGCGDGCHVWTQSAYGNEKIINSWWYITKDPISSSIKIETYALAIEDDKTICEGEEIELLGPDDMVSYSWTPVENIQQENQQNAKVSPKTDTEYKLTIIDQKGCEYQDSLVVFVNSLPVLEATANPAKICIGQSSTLNVSGAKTYTWDNNLGTGNTQTVSPTLGQTIYEVIGVDNNGCKDTMMVDVTVNPLPEITVSDEEICLNESVELSASGGVSYLWKNNITGLSSIIVSNPEASPNITSTYTVEVTDANECINEKEVVVIVNPLPEITVSDEEICLNESVGLLASGGVSYMWKNITTGLSSTIVSNPEANPLNTTTYTVEVTTDKGCIGEQDVMVTVNPLPIINAVTTPAKICVGQSTILNANGAVTYTWNNNLGTGNIQTVSPSVGKTTYEVIGVDSKGCENITTVEVEVDNLPEIIVSDEEICLNESVELSASGGVSYLWKNNTTGLSSTSVSNPDANPLSTSTYTVEVIDNNGCVNEKDVVVTVNPLPVIVTQGGEVCEGKSVGLFAGGGVSYLWKNNTTGLSSTTSSSPTATPTMTTTYTVEVTTDKGCIDEKDAIVIINPLPTPVFVNPKQMVCPGEIVDYQVNGFPFSTFEWTFTPIEAIESSILKNDLVTLTFANDLDGIVNFEVREITDKLCQATINTNVVIDNLVTIDFDLSDGICVDADPISLNMATPTIGGVGTYYLNGGLVTELNPTTLPQSVPLDVKYEFVTNQGCIYEEEEDIIIHPLPVVNFSPITAICSNDDPIELNNATPKNGTYSGVGVNNNLFDPKALGVLLDAPNNITYTYTDPNGCVDSKVSTISVNVQPDIFIKEDLFVCDGFDGTLEAETDEIGVTYQWYKDGIMLNGATNPFLVTDEEGSYQVQIDQTVCSSISESKNVNIVYLDVEAGNTQTILYEEQAILSGNVSVDHPSQEYELQWLINSNDNVVTVDQLTTLVEPEATTTYTLVATDQYGCTAEDVVTIIVLDPILIPNGFTPNGDNKNETWMVANISDYPTSLVRVYNRWGNLVYSDEGYLNDWNGTDDDGEPLPNATYYYIVELNYRDLEYAGSVTIVR